MWIRDYHIDGLRLDAVHAIVDESPLHILEQLATEGARGGSDGASVGRLLIAESDANDPRLVRGRDAGGYGLDAAWADDWHHALHVALTGERIGYYEDFGVSRAAWEGAAPGLGLRRRVVGRTGRRCAAPNRPVFLPKAFVIATQNHDQVGNRATGDRLAALVDEGRLKVAAALLLTSPFTPLLFQGEEWAASTPFLYFTDHADPASARQCRRAGGASSPRSAGTRTRCRTRRTRRLRSDRSSNGTRLDEPSHRRMLDWYRDLIAMRRRHARPCPRARDVQCATVRCWEPNRFRARRRRRPT